MRLYDQEEGETMLEQIFAIIGQTFADLSSDIIFAGCLMLILLLCDRFFSVLEYVLHLIGGGKRW